MLSKGLPAVDWFLFENYFVQYMFGNIDIFSSPFLDICAFRLDFETFQTEGPSTFTEASGGACVDTFQVTTVNIWP